MAGLDKVRREQLELGAADWFRPYPESAAPFNQIKVDAGVFFNPSTPVPHIMGVQTSPSFAVVAAGFYRYDLVYLDASGTVQRQAGTPQATPVTPYNGAPGKAGGPAMSQAAFPIAYVLVEETGTVVVDDDDITDIRGISEHYEPGVVGDMQADGAASISVTGTRRFVPSAHRHPLNTDGTIPEDTDQAGPGVPGASGVYADRAHIHRIDPALIARVVALEGGAVAYLNLGDTLYLEPDYGAASGLGGGWYDTYALHSFQANLWEFVSPGVFQRSPVWFDLDPTQTPLYAKLDNLVGLQHGDAGAATFPKTGADTEWFYLYAIKTTKSGVANPQRLVWSNRAPDLGPDLDHPTFTTDEWKYFRLVAAAKNISDGSDPARTGYELLAFTKNGRLVQYDTALNLSPALVGGQWTPVTAQKFIPPTAWYGYFSAIAGGGGATASHVYLRTSGGRPQSLLPSGGGPAPADRGYYYIPTGSGGTVPLSGSPEWHLTAIAPYCDSDNASWGSEVGFLRLDDGRNLEVLWDVTTGSVVVLVLGYMENPDFRTPTY